MRKPLWLVRWDGNSGRDRRGFPAHKGRWSDRGRQQIDMGLLQWVREGRNGVERNEEYFATSDSPGL